MIQNNNTSILPWFINIEDQFSKRWWTYGHIYPLYCKAGKMPPFQCTVPYHSGDTLTKFILYKADGTVISDQIAVASTQVKSKEFSSLGYTIIYYDGLQNVLSTTDEGQYYVVLQYGTYMRTSDVFTAVGDISRYLKVSWSAVEDILFEDTRLLYDLGGGDYFTNFVLLQAELAKPQYIFEEEGETRDGYFFPIKQISEKRYRFSFLASEYLLDAMRFVRMADTIEIESEGKYFPVDTFLITPEWENEGDLAAVTAEFDSFTVAKKLGRLA